MSTFDIGGDQGGPIRVLAAAEPATLDDWDAARQIPPGPDRAFLVGRYVHGGNPPNRNGHVFKVEQLAKAQRMIPFSPLDMLHDPKRIVGTFAASTIVHPSPTARQAAPAFTEAPYVKVLASVWSYHFPEATRAIQAAFENNTAFFSHSCLPSAVECPSCGNSTPWLGYTHEDYCDHVQGVNAKVFDDPLFLGGAVIIPPIKPGWGDAYITQVDRFINRHSEAAERAHEAIDALAGNATPREIEELAAQALLLAYPEHPDILAEARRLTPGFTPTTAAALAAEQTGVIVALVPPSSMAERLAELGDQPADEIHMTMCFLGDAVGGAVQPAAGGDPVSSEVLAAAVAVWSDSEKPIMASTSGIGTFAQPDGSVVNYVSLDAPGLNEMRARLVSALAAAGIEIRTDHGFTPHITLSYQGEPPAAEDVAGMSWMVEGVEIWWAGTHVEVEFG